MKQNKPKLSLGEWLMQPPNPDSATHMFSESFMRHLMNIVGLLGLYTTSVFFFHLLRYFYHLGWFDFLIRALINLLTIPTQPGNLGTFSVLVLVVVGYVLYLFKKYQQFYYGIVETVFALVNFQILTQTIRDSSFVNARPSYVVWLTGMTTLYLMVRGLSNIDDGWKKGFYLHKLFHYFALPQTLNQSKEQ